jgi:MerR family transcriptional regulator, copper efflux regulator
MLRYLERIGLIVPTRTASGYRLYGLRELNQLRSLRELRARFRVEIAEIAFAARLRREPALRAAVETWLTGSGIEPHSATPAWVDWEQRKHERLLAA